MSNVITWIFLAPLYLLVGVGALLLLLLPIMAVAEVFSHLSIALGG